MNIHADNTILSNVGVLFKIAHYFVRGRLLAYCSDMQKISAFMDFMQCKLPAKIFTNVFVKFKKKRDGVKIYAIKF